MSTSVAPHSRSPFPSWLFPADPEARYRLGLRIAAVGLLLAAAVGGILLWQYQPRLAKDPLDWPPYKVLKEKLAKDPTNEYIKSEIRRIDLQIRRDYFRKRTLAAGGAWILLVALAAALFCARWAATLHRPLPVPKTIVQAEDPDIRSTRWGRWAVALFSAVLAAGVLLLSRSFSNELPRTETELAALLHPAAAAPVVAAVVDTRPAKPPVSPPQPTGPNPPLAVSPSAPAKDEAAENWPRFRGPGGLGICKETGFATAWDAKSGKNIVWKTPIPLPGNNSPILWGDRLFMSGADENKRAVYCVAAADGKLLWQQEVPLTSQGTGEVKVSDDTGLAASSMATDGRAAYAVFPNGDVVACDFAGKQLWLRGFGIPKSEYGYASSLVCYNNRLLIQFDQGEASDKLSKLMALDSTSGKTIWETPRPVPNCWSTPLVIRVGDRDQIVASGDPWVIGYNAADGKELWRSKSLRQDIGPSPVFAGGLVYVASEFPALSAIKPDGSGNVTATHVVWKGEDGLPDTCSPLATEKFVILLSTPGTLTCYDGKQGKKYWEKDFESEFRASPSMAGGKVYLLGAEGKAWVVELSAEGCKEVGKGELGENCVASPVFHAGRMYLRGKGNLYCVGTK